MEVTRSSRHSQHIYFTVSRSCTCISCLFICIVFNWPFIFARTAVVMTFVALTALEES